MFQQERFRRSFSLTGYLLSGSGAGALTCWFLVGNLYGNQAPTIVLRMLVTASGLFLTAVVCGFIAALAGFMTFETAVVLRPEEFGRPSNGADRWMVAMLAARLAAALLITAGGLLAFAAYAHLGWR